jgi:putative ABC transport system permease protein
MASDATLMPLHVEQGAWPAASGQIAITPEAAHRLGVKIGGRIFLEPSADSSVKGNFPVTVVGLTDDPDGAYSYSAGAAVMSNDDFYTVTGFGQHLDEMAVTSIYLSVSTEGRSKAQVDATVAQVKKALPTGFTVNTRQKAADEAIKQIGNGQNVITTFLLVFGVIALLVAALVIANTFQVLVAQRRRTLALLRTIGAKKGQLYRSVLLEATFLGAVSSALGIVLAVVLMEVLSLLHIQGLAGGDFVVTLDWRVIVIPLIFGVVMTILASLGSARMATSVTPLEALQPIELSSAKRGGVVRGLLSLVGIIGGGALVAMALVGTHAAGAGSDVSESDFTMNLAMAVGGGALLFLGLVVSALWWMPLLMRGAGALVSACGPSAKIAAANVQKNPRRVAATGAALLVGVTLVTAISTGAASAKQTLADTLSHNYAVDVQVSGASLNEAALGKVRKVEGVKSAALLRTAAASMPVQGKKDSLEVGMVGITTAQRKSLVRADVSTPATAGIVVMNKTLPNGKANPYKNGDTVTFTAEAAKSTRTVDLTVVLKDFMPVTQTQVTAFVEPNVVDSLAEHGVETTMDIWAQVGEGTSAIQLVSDVQDAVSTYPGATVSGPFAEREMWETSINVVMAVLIGLLAVSVIIALIGVANTLSLSVIERTRESATLRAIGMTKRQLRTSLGVEALIIAVVAGIVGLVLGVGFGWLGSTVILSTIGTVSFQIDWAMCAAVMVIAIAAALVSSIAPARRAVKTSPVVALAEA